MICFQVYDKSWSAFISMGIHTQNLDETWKLERNIFRWNRGGIRRETRWNPQSKVGVGDVGNR